MKLLNGISYFWDQERLGQWINYWRIYVYKHFLEIVYVQIAACEIEQSIDRFLNQIMLVKLSIEATTLPAMSLLCHHPSEILKPKKLYEFHKCLFIFFACHFPVKRVFANIFACLKIQMNYVKKYVKRNPAPDFFGFLSQIKSCWSHYTWYQS